MTGHLFVCVLAAGMLAMPALAQTPQATVQEGTAKEGTARIANASEPVLCAEKDNIYIPFTADAVKGFRIRALHPAYIGGLIADRWAADWANCDFGGDPAPGTKPRAPERITLYEDLELQVIGLKYPEFWRPADVPVTIAGKRFDGLHLVQVWMRAGNSAEEFLVVYPPDGYWRARPLPPPHMKWTAYGSSFMVGPVSVEGRPVVALTSIAFDPASKTFDLAFRKGGSAKVKVAAIDPEQQALDVTFSADMPRGQPFAGLRSMYVTEFNNDAARIAWRGRGANAWGEAHIMEFKPFEAVEVWMGRHGYSRHNTSAPDMVFDRFVDR